MKHNERVIVEDVEISPLFTGTPSLEVLRSAGVRAVQSTPLVNRNGNLIGILTTQWSVPHTPDKHDLWRIDLLAQQATDFVENWRAAEALRKSHDELEIRVQQRTEDLRKTNEHLKRSNEDLEHFAYVASHDLQEPLRTVAGALQMLELDHKGKLGEDSDRLINYAVDGAKKMRSLVADLLTYSRIAGGNNEFTEVETQSLLDQTIGNLKGLIHEKKSEITYDKMPKVVGDSTQLLQVFQNLIGNALKFGPAESPKIHISARLNGGEWVFSVKDNGIGIEQQYFDRIFVVFQQLEKKDSAHGTGIGLSIVKRVVERHHGRIWVESELGAGSTFYFTIPIGRQGNTSALNC